MCCTTGTRSFCAAFRDRLQTRGIEPLVSGTRSALFDRRRRYLRACTPPITSCGLAAVWTHWVLSLLIRNARNGRRLAPLRLFWTRTIRRGKPTRPSVARDVRDLIHGISGVNPRYPTPPSATCCGSARYRRDEREQYLVRS